MVLCDMWTRLVPTQRNQIFDTHLSNNSLIQHRVLKPVFKKQQTSHYTNHRNVFCVYLYPGIPPASILFATVTSVDHTSYCHRFWPSTPPRTVPLWTPTRMSTSVSVFSRTYLQMVDKTFNPVNKLARSITGHKSRSLIISYYYSVSLLLLPLTHTRTHTITTIHNPRTQPQLSSTLILTPAQTLTPYNPNFKLISCQPKFQPRHQLQPWTLPNPPQPKFAPAPAQTPRPSQISTPRNCRQKMHHLSSFAGMCKKTQQCFFLSFLLRNWMCLPGARL